MIIRGEITQVIAQGHGCGATFDGHPIYFLAPVDLQPDDKLAVETRTGQPLAIFRLGEGTIWVYQPELKARNEFTLTGTLTDEGAELLKKLRGALYGHK